MDPAPGPEQAPNNPTLGIPGSVFQPFPELRQPWECAHSLGNVQCSTTFRGKSFSLISSLSRNSFGTEIPISSLAANSMGIPHPGDSAIPRESWTHHHLILMECPLEADSRLGHHDAGSVPAVIPPHPDVPLPSGMPENPNSRFFPLFPALRP